MLLFQVDTPAGVAVTSSPGVAYAALVYLVGVPIEKWVSVAVLLFTVLQIIFLVKDRMKKRRARKGTG
jgi:dolichyl-phosphate-mannose--protein O-mannosyl transferase